MAIAPITQVSGTAIPIPGADIDTDRIIPARFMKCVTFDGLGEYAFYDVRFDPESGEKTDHPLNDERFDGASILVAGINFGCGSSREHAPPITHEIWLQRYHRRVFCRNLLRKFDDPRASLRQLHPRKHRHPQSGMHCRPNT
ncbi:hypothetical protein OAE60_01690 [Akkermansiaceae bacterium]|nr:hypothetical protein [Akkermansiaceae bacterium]